MGLFFINYGISWWKDETGDCVPWNYKTDEAKFRSKWSERQQ